jgi:hypothetical protein
LNFIQFREMTTTWLGNVARLANHSSDPLVRATIAITGKRCFMRPLVTALVLGWFCVTSASQAFSASPTPDGQNDAEQSISSEAKLDWGTTTVDLSAGYRRDKLTWSIAGNLQGTDPNVRSELSWSDLDIYQLKLANRTVIKEHVTIRGHLDYGSVTTGNNRDSDYNGDDRTQEFSRSLNGVDGNNVWDGSIGIGPRFSFFNAEIEICPLVGYAVSEQDLNIVDGFQAISALPPLTPPVGPIAGLDSRYQTRWQGPWIGADVSLSTPCTEGPFNRITVLFTCEYHWVDYDADANWNLRADYQHPVSFTHEAEGTGFVVGTKILFSGKNRWGLNVGMTMQEMTTDPGLDRIYYADGSTADTRLNEVEWRAFTFEAGLSYRF